MKFFGIVIATVLISAGALSAQEESIPRFEVGLT